MPTPLPRAKEGRPEAAISPKARALIGVVTTLAFTVVGVSFLLSQRYGVGALLLVFAAIRGSVAARQLQRVFFPEPEEDDSKD